MCHPGSAVRPRPGPINTDGRALLEATAIPIRPVFMGPGLALRAIRDDKRREFSDV
jgi:hypothetical protein